MPCASRLHDPSRPAQVLLIEPDAARCRWLAQGLRAAGHQVHTAASDSALMRAPALGVELLLLNPGAAAPGRADGAWQQLQRLQSQQAAGRRLPVIALWPGADAIDRTLALELGADAVLHEPCCDHRELLARAAGLLRRHRESRTGSDGLAVAGWTLQPQQRALRRPDGRSIVLPPTAWRLLAVLMAQAGRPVPRAVLLARALGPGIAMHDRNIDLQVSRLRRLIGDGNGSGNSRRNGHGQARVIHTVRGVGYRFAPEAGSEANVSNAEHERHSGLTALADIGETGQTDPGRPVTATGLRT